VSALLNIMSMYHDTLLARIVPNDPKYKPLIPSSLHTRYTSSWSAKDHRYKWAARILELFRFTELVIEMGLRRKVSTKNRWRGIVLLETIKCVRLGRVRAPAEKTIRRAVLRLVLVRITHRPLLTPPIPERDFDPSTLPSPSNASSPTLVPTSPSHSLPTTPEHLKNNHVPLDPHPLLLPSPSNRSDMSVEDYLQPKALTTSSVKVSTSLIKALSSPQDWLSEIIYIIRPLVYGEKLFNDTLS
jgi:peroxin-16